VLLGEESCDGDRMSGLVDPVALVPRDPFTWIVSSVIVKLKLMSYSVKQY